MNGEEIRTETTHRFVWEDGIISPIGTNLVGGKQSEIAIFKVGANVYFRNMEPESRSKVSFLMRWQDLIDRVEQMKTEPEWTHDDVISLSIGLDDSVGEYPRAMIRREVKHNSTLDTFLEGL